MQSIMFIRRIPTKSGDRQNWIDAIKTNQIFDEKASLRFAICDLHFLPENINREKTRNKLKNGAIPSIFPNKERYVALA